jgi:hypothetical protein
MSAATFSCPHCAASYPFKPVFGGKTVRCKACSKPFTVQADGTAIPVAPLVTAPVTPAAPVATIAPAPRPAPVPGQSTSPTPADRPSERIATNKKLQDTRDKISASLSQIMGAAAAETRPSSGRVQRNAPVRKGADGKPQLGPPVLTGEGEREARISRQWTLAILAGLLVIGLAGWWLRQDNPRTAAIIAFTDEVSPADNKYGLRHKAIAARGLLSSEAFAGGTLGLFTAMPDVRFAVERRIPGTLLVDLALRFKSPPADRKAAIKAAVDAGLDEDAAQVVVNLLLGETTLGVNAIRTKLQNGTTPKELEWCAFWGKDGTHLQDMGGNYKTTFNKPYRGVLARFTGEGWAGPWRVLTLGPDKL